MRRLRYLILLSIIPTGLAAQKFDAQEFADRRAELLERTGDGVTVLLGNVGHLHTVRFHQSPDFFYLTGISEPDGVLVMDGDDRSSTVFLRQLSPFEAMWNGPRLLNDPEAESRFGVTMRPLSALKAYLLEILADEDKLYLEVDPPDQLQASRNEVVGSLMDYKEHPLLGKRPSEIEVAIAMLRSMQPDADVVNVSELLDEMRWTKSPYEVERLREAGRIGAEGIVDAMRITRPGIWEYELEAATRYIYQKNGAGDAFLPIVASGPNTMVIHYQENNRQVRSGDVILMDYGAEVDGYTSDITRMWPASGRFSPSQEKIYQCILEASKAVIAAIKPGVMESDLQDIAGEVYKRHGFQKEFEQFGRYIGHPVGLSVHDPDPGYGPAPDVPFVEGTVFNVEPLLTVSEQGVHMRLEDTILVTADGAENLTAGVPVEIDEIYALIGANSSAGSSDR